MSRTTRISSSLAIILIAYWAYALLAVPWIEPPSTTAISSRHDKPGLEGEEPHDLQMKQFVGLFPPDHWIWKGKTIVLESNRAKLLLQNYRNVEGGRMEIWPCVIVFPHEGPTESEEQRRRQSIILETPRALLQFDPPLNFNQPKATRMVNGQLKGDVIIRSDWKEPGPEDDLLIEASEVQITEHSISTPNPVKFHWGPHYGSGRDLEIKLLTAAPKPGAEATGGNITGIESIDLRHVDLARFDLGKTSLSPAGKSDGGQAEIRCAGPFRFDAVRRVATFRDHVNVLRPNPSGTPDQLDCELLSVFFTDRSLETAAVAADKKKDPGTLDLVAERLEAKGTPMTPVVVSAPNYNKFSARAPRIEYNLLAKSMVADGPGWFRGQPNDRPDRALEAVWRRELQIFPKEQSQVITLAGGAALKSKDAELQADEIFFRLAPSSSSPAEGQPDLRPEMMLARKDVRLKSLQLSGRVEQLEIWFEEAKDGGRASTADESASTNPVALVQPSPPAATALPPPTRQYELVGRAVSARVAIGGPEPKVPYLRVEGGVQILETQTSRPGEQPLLLRGDRLEAFDITAPNGRATIAGQPAHFEGGGLSLDGASICVDSNANRLWIDGAGRMNMPMPAGGLTWSQNQPGSQNAASPQAQPALTGTLTVDWRRRMEFNGSEIVFEQSVVAKSQYQQLCTGTMTIELARPVRFSEMKAQETPQASEIRCRGGVAIENQNVDAQQQPASFDHLHVVAMTVNLLNGEMRAEGPGWLNSVWRGDGNMLGGGAAQPGAPAGNPNQLNCVHVKFQGPATGNFQRKLLVLHDQVRTAFAPVASWDAVISTENPDQLGPNGLVSGCDQLSLARVIAPLAAKETTELVALGNATVEGKTRTDGKNFMARGQRISYDEAKDLLILEGDGRSLAELFMQAQHGDPVSRYSTQTIRYWHKTGAVDTSGMRMIESQVPPERRK
jgi:hypothetical protein